MLRRYCTRLYANRNVESVKSWWSFLQGIADALPGNCQRIDAILLARKPRANQFIVQILDLQLPVQF
jgi:hypothetical protein